MHTIAAEIILIDDANNACLECTKPEANRIETVNLFETTRNVVG